MKASAKFRDSTTFDSAALNDQYSSLSVIAFSLLLICRPAVLI